MIIKSILLEIEDDELGYRKVLLSDFVNQYNDKTEMEISENHNLGDYPYNIMTVLKSNFKINIGLECSGYKVTDITKSEDKGEL